MNYSVDFHSEDYLCWQKSRLMKSLVSFPTVSFYSIFLKKDILYICFFYFYVDSGLYLF